MDDLIVRLARALACRERLRILSRLMVSDELAPSELARDLSLSPSSVSTHVGKLSTTGLLRRRHSGAWSYCIGESYYADSTLSGMTVAWLRMILSSPNKTRRDCGLKQVRNPFSDAAMTPIYDLIENAATAFTDLRRLQILRYLTRHNQASSDELRATLKMSPWALSRHVHKLARRGYIRLHESGRAAAYRLSDRPKTPIHREMCRIVQSAWKKMR